MKNGWTTAMEYGLRATHLEQTAESNVSKQILSVYPVTYFQTESMPDPLCNASKNINAAFPLSAAFFS